MRIFVRLLCCVILYCTGLKKVFRHGISGVGMAMNMVVLSCRILVRANVFFAVPVLDLEG